MANEVNGVYSSEEILNYITRLCEATRNNPLITLGISPRGALALNRLAKAHAYVFGRDYVVPADVADILCEVWAHRIVISSKAKLDEKSSHSILTEILSQVEINEKK